MGDYLWEVTDERLRMLVESSERLGTSREELYVIFRESMSHSTSPTEALYWQQLAARLKAMGGID